MRKFIAVACITLVFTVVVIFLSARFWKTPHPLELKAVSVEPSGMVDDAGTEALLVTLQLVNRSNGSVHVLTNDYQVDALIGGHWFAMRDHLRTPSRVLGARNIEELVVAPGGTSACRLNLHYLPEPLKLRMWRRLGVRPQKAMERRLPKTFFKWLFKPQSSRPEDYKPLCLEVKLAFASNQISNGYVNPSANPR